MSSLYSNMYGGRECGALFRKFNIYVAKKAILFKQKPLRSFLTENQVTINLGNKRTCVGCGAKFYDLGKNPAKCPKCATVNDINISQRRRGRAKAAAAGDSDDPLLKEKAKMELRQAKAKKPVKEIEGVDLDAFEDIEPIAGDDDIEEIEEDEMETLESLEELDEGDDVDAEEEEIEGEVLIDEIDEDDDEDEDDEDEDEEEDEDEDERPTRKSASKASKKPAPKKPVAKAAVKKPAKKR